MAALGAGPELVTSDLGESPLTGGEHNLTVAQARAAIAAALRPVSEAQSLPLLLALGRVLAADIVSPIDVPAHDNSAMDGYAFAGSALLPGGVTRLRLVGTVMAGAPDPRRIADGECLGIMTGAVMPGGADTVVPRELCDVEGDIVGIQAGTVQAGENLRRRGEDLARGQTALRTGRVLKAADLGLTASLGIEQVSVVRRLRVALFSTGDELRAPGQPLEAGCIYDSNRYSLMGALQRLGVEIIDLGLVRDDPAALRDTLGSVVGHVDAVLTSGGVSMGDADHLREVLGHIGEVAFWKVAMRPGRPFAFGPLHATMAPSSGVGSETTWLFALPGNPVAALVTFYVLARDGLLQLAGAAPQPLPVLRARSVSPIRKRPGRTEFQRAIVEHTPAGDWQVRLTGTQGAGVLRSMSEANALLVLGHDQGTVAAGDWVDVWLFDGLT